MKKAFLYFILSLSWSVIHGQTIELDTIFAPKLSGEIYQKTTGISGKQVYNDDWAESDIKLSSGELVFDKLLKYNELQDEVIWFQPDNSRQIKLEKHFIDEFCFKNYNGKSVRFKRIQIRLPNMTDSTDIFVEVLYDKTVSLCVFRNLIINGTVRSIENGILYTYDTLVPQPVYILKLPDGKTVTFKRVKRSVLLKALPGEYKSSVKKIILQNNLQIQSETDVIKLAGLIN